MVYVFLADGFEEIEALTPVDLMRRAGIDVATVGIGGDTVRGAHGIYVKADISEKEANVRLLTGDAEMIILPGGMPGTKNLLESSTVDAFINDAVKRNIYIAAICAAPMILGRKGLLCAKNAACFPGFENELEGARVTTERVVCDGKIITSRALGTAGDFALELILRLKGAEEAEKIRAAVIL